MQRSKTSSFTPFTSVSKEVRPIKRRVALLQAAVVGAGSHTPPAPATMTAVFGVRGRVQAMVRAFETGKVNPGSKAAQRGVREGDVISSINGQATRHITNSEAHGLLKSAGHTLQLGLNEESSGSPKRRAFRGQHQQDSRSTESIKRSSSVSSTGSAGSSASVKTTVTVNGSASEANNTATPAASTATSDATGPTVNGSTVGETKKETSQQNGTITKEVTIITSTNVHTSTDAKERRESEPSSNSSASAAGDASAAQRLLPEAGAPDEDTPRRRKRGNSHGGATGTAKGVGTATSAIRPQTNDIDETKNYSFKRIRGDAGAESPEDSTTTPEAIDTPPVGRRKRQCVSTPEPGTSASSSTNTLRGRNDPEKLTIQSLAFGKAEERESQKPENVAFRDIEKNIKPPTSPDVPGHPPPVGRIRKQMTDKPGQGQSSELLTPKILTRNRSGDASSTPEGSSTPDVASPAQGRRSKLNRPENAKISSPRSQELEYNKKDTSGSESQQTPGRRRRPEPEPSESSTMPKIEVVDMSAYGYSGTPSDDVLSPEASSGSGTGGMGSGGGDEDEPGGSTVLSRAKRRRLRAQRARRRSEITLADTQGKANVDNPEKTQEEIILRGEGIDNLSMAESTTKTSDNSCKNSTTVETTDKENTNVSNRTRGQRIKNNSSISINTNNSAEVKHSPEIHEGITKDSNFTETFQRELKVSAAHQKGNQQFSETIIGQQMKRFVRRSTTCTANEIQSTVKSELEDVSKRIIISSSSTVNASGIRVSKRETRTRSLMEEIVQDTGLNSELESKLLCITAPQDINSQAREISQELLVGEEGMGNDENIHSSEEKSSAKPAPNNKNEKISREQTKDMIKENIEIFKTNEDKKESSFNSNETNQIGFEEIMTSEKDKNENQEAKHETNVSGEDTTKKEEEDHVTCRRRKVVRMASQEELLDAVEEVSGLCVSADAGCVLPATSVQAGVGSGRDSRVFEEVLVAPIVIQDDSVSSSTKLIPSLCNAPSTNVSSDLNHSSDALDALAENTLSYDDKNEVEGNKHFQTESNIDDPLTGEDSEENIKYIPDSVYNKTEPIGNSNNSIEVGEKDFLKEETISLKVPDSVQNAEVSKTMKDDNCEVSESVISERNDWKQFEERWKKNLTKLSQEMEHKALTKEPFSTCSNEMLVDNQHILSETIDGGLPSHKKSSSRISEQDVRTEPSLDTPGTLCDVDGRADPVSLPVLNASEEGRESCLSNLNHTSSTSLHEVQSDPTINSSEIRDHQETIETELSPLVTHEEKFAPGTLKSSRIDKLDSSVNISDVTDRILVSENSCISNITNNEIITSPKTTNDTTSDVLNKTEGRSGAQEKKVIPQAVVSEVKEIELSLSVESLILSDGESKVLPETLEQSLGHPGDEKVGVNYREDAAITVAEMGNQLCLAHSSKKDDDAAASAETVAMKVVTAAAAARGVCAAEEAGDGEAADGGAARRPSVSRNVRRGGIDVSVQRADGNDYASVPGASADAVLGMDDGEDGNITERALVTEQRGQFTVFTLGSGTSSVKSAPEIQVTLAEDFLEDGTSIDNIDSNEEFDNSSSSVAVARLLESDEIWEVAQELIIIEYDPDNPPNEELLDSTDLVRSNTTPVHRDEGDEEYEDAEDGYYEEEEDERELTEEEVDLLDARPAMPPEEEESLRCFLRTLQLVETPDKPRRTSLEESEEAAAIRKASKKRVSDAAAEYYAQFFPPSRCLDVIVEETSDVSDNERKNESAVSSGHSQVVKSTDGENVAEVDSGDVQSPEDEDEMFQEAEEDDEENVEEGEDTKTVIVTSTSTSSVHVTENDGFCVRRVFHQRSWLRTGISDQERPRVVISEAEEVVSGSESPGPEQRVELPDSSCLTSPEEPEEVTWARGEASAPQTGVEVVFLEDDSASEAASASVGGGEPEDDELEEPLREAAAEHIGRIVRMAQTVEVMTCELEGDSGSEGEAVTVTPRESDSARQEHASSVKDDETPLRQTSDTPQNNTVPTNEVTSIFGEYETNDRKEEKIEKIESHESEDRAKLNIENSEKIEPIHVFSECQEVNGDKGKISAQQTPDSIHTDSIESAPTETLDGVASISSDSFEVINVTVLATKDNLRKESEKVSEAESVLLKDLKTNLDVVARVEGRITATKEMEITVKTLDSVELSTMIFNENTDANKFNENKTKETSITNEGISESENNNNSKEEPKDSERENLGESITSFIEPDVPEDKMTLNKEENSKLFNELNSDVMGFESTDRDVNILDGEDSSITETSISIEEIENMKRLRKEVAESLAKRKAESHHEDESDISEKPTSRVGYARGAGLCYINLPPQKPQVSLTPPSPEESQSTPNVAENLRTDKDFVQKLMNQDLNSSSVYSVLSSLTLAQVASLSPELKHNLEALMGLKARSGCEEQEVRNESPLLAPNHSHQCSSSSDSTSHNTALFNPSASRTSSPFADVSASCNDRETPAEGRTPLPLDTPPALKVLALESVLALPRGLDVLRALGSQLVKKQVPPPPPARRHIPALRGQQLASVSSNAGTLPGVSSPLPPPLPTPPPPPPETWTAIPSDEDPRLLLCLSPSQMKELTLHENVSAHELLDLHRKFSERRGYHESPPPTPPRPPPAPPRRLLGGSSGDSTPCSICSPPPSRADGIRAHLSPRALQRMQQQIATATASPSPRRGGHTAVATPIPGMSSPLTSPRAKIPASERLPAILRGSALGAADSSPPTPLPTEMLKFVRRPDGSATPDSVEQDPHPQMQRATSWFGDEDPNRAARLKAQLLSEWLSLARSSAPCSRSSTPAPGGVASPSSPAPGRRIPKSAEEKEGYRRLTEQLSSLSKQLEEHRAHKKRFSLPPDAQRTQQVREDARPQNGGAMRGGATTLPPMSPRMSRLSDGVDDPPKKDTVSEQRENGAHEDSSKGMDSVQSLSQDEEEQLIRQLQRQESSQEESDPAIPPASATRRFDADQYVISKQGDIAVLQSDTPPSGARSTRPQALSAPAAPTAPTDGELFRQQMYEEYMHKVCERAERRRHRVIRISTRSDEGAASNTAPGPLSPPATAPPPHLETEFLGRVRERMDKLGLRYDSEGEDTSAAAAAAAAVAEEAGAGDAAYVIEAGDGSALQAEVVQALPKHLQELLLLPSDSDTEGPAMIAPRFKATSPVPGVWTPGAKASTAANASDGESTSQPHPQQQPSSSSSVSHQDATPPSSQAPPTAAVWTPRSASASPVAERREFRPVKFESPTLQRKNRAASASPAPKPPTLDTEARSTSAASTPPASSATTSGSLPPWEAEISAATAAANTIEVQRQQLEQLQQASAAALLSSRLVQSQSAPASGLSGLAATSQRLPRAQNPTITLLQKAREGQLPRGAHYLDRMNSRESDKDLQLGQNDIMYSVKKEYQKETETGSKKVVELTPRKFEGIGPTTTEGVPIVLRSEIKEPNQAKWYKRMYDSLHKSGKDGHYPYTSAGGYLSEPEPLGYDSDIGFTAKYATLDRRRIKNKENDFTTSTLPRSKYLPHSAAIKYGADIYKNQPGRIEDYEPGHSSISDKETKQWWDEVLDIFDGAQSEQKMMPSVSSGKPFMSYALKESGYESDSTLVFKRRDENLQNQLSPEQQKLAYKTIQRGGEVPLHGLRKPAPERPKESPHRYVESEVTIHYRSPVRAEQKEVLPEEELARRQAEAMRRIYQEERRRKYLQELQDMQSRRHTDNFTPSQKSPIPLNRYDDILDDLSAKHKTRDRTPEPKLVARALYNFVGQTSRELSFRRGDIIFVRRQIDKNWYEGEHNAMVGLFPLNYVEIIPYDGIRTMPKRPTEGQARAKFNFVAQTHLELSLVKGELVVLTRRVDENWYEGRIGNKKGIFPVSYVEVLSEPGERAVTPSSTSNKPVSSTTSRSLLTNGSSTKQTYQTYQSQHTPASSYYNRLGTSYTANNPYATMPRQGQTGRSNMAPMTQTLHIDTHSEPVPYRALYNYRPQNEDELELVEGDTVYVMEKCDDGWYVGSSQRTGFFGTFPGNYVERL